MDLDRGRALHVGPDDFAYIAGQVDSAGFPSTPGVFDGNDNGQDGFLVKVSQDGTSLVFSGFIGGMGADDLRDLALDAGGSAYVTGYTLAYNDFPTTPDVFQPSWPGQATKAAYLTKVSSDGSTLLYSTYIGGQDNNTEGYSVGASPTGRAGVAGLTTSPTFPVTPGAFDTTWNGNNAFVMSCDFCGAWTPYGTAFAPAGGTPPELEGAGCATSGHPVTLTLTGSPFLPGVLLFGQGTGVIPVVPQCRLQIAPLTPLVLPFAVPASGTLVLPGTLPPAVPATLVTMQAFLADPAAPYGVSATAPLKMQLAP